MACSKRYSGNLKHILSTVRTILSEQSMRSNATDPLHSEAGRALQRLTTDRTCFPESQNAKSQNALWQCSASLVVTPSPLPVLHNTVCRSQSSTQIKPSPKMKLYKMPSLKRYRIYNSSPTEMPRQLTGKTESAWMPNGCTFSQTGCRPTSKYVDCGHFFTAAGTGCRHRRLLLNIPSPHIFQQCRSVKSVKVEAGEVSVEDIKQVLTQAEMKFDQGFTCFVTRCLCLGQNKKKTKPTTDSENLYINMTTGHFLCQHCSKRGSWQDLQDNILLLSSLTPRRRKAFECFKDLDSVQVADQSSLQAEKLWESALPITACAADVVAQIQENFDIHELNPNTLEAYGVRFDVASNSLVFPVYNDAQRMIGAHRMRCTIPKENNNVRVVQSSPLPNTEDRGSTPSVSTM